MANHPNYMSSYMTNSLAIRQEIQRFESVHPSIYAIYDLIELVPDPLLAQQIREHVVCIEGKVFQAKGFPYSLQSLLGDSPFSENWNEKLEGGYYLTLRLTSSMYHRFHAPCDVQLKHVTYISGDTWNVNPIALKRVEQLFCKNERIVMHLQTPTAVDFLMIPVAAVLVASMRRTWLFYVF